MYSWRETTNATCLKKRNEPEGFVLIFYKEYIVKHGLLWKNTRKALSVTMPLASISSCVIMEFQVVSPFLSGI